MVASAISDFRAWYFQQLAKRPAWYAAQAEKLAAREMLRTIERAHRRARLRPAQRRRLAHLHRRIRSARKRGDRSRLVAHLHRAAHEVAQMTPQGSHSYGGMWGRVEKLGRKVGAFVRDVYHQAYQRVQQENTISATPALAVRDLALTDNGGPPTRILRPQTQLWTPQAKPTIPPTRLTLPQSKLLQLARHHRSTQQPAMQGQLVRQLAGLGRPLSRHYILALSSFGGNASHLTQQPLGLGTTCGQMRPDHPCGTNCDQPPCMIAGEYLNLPLYLNCLEVTRAWKDTFYMGRHEETALEFVLGARLDLSYNESPLKGLDINIEVYCTPDGWVTLLSPLDVGGRCGYFLNIGYEISASAIMGSNTNIGMLLGMISFPDSPGAMSPAFTGGSTIAGNEVDITLASDGGVVVFLGKGVNVGVGGSPYVDLATSIYLGATVEEANETLSHLLYGE